MTGRAVARAMVAQGSGGSIVNMSSVNASLVIPGMAGYVASKGGVQQLTRLMAIELASSAIRVNAIAPGSVGTEMAFATYRDPTPVEGLGLTKEQLMRARTPLGRMARPEEMGAQQPHRHRRCRLDRFCALPRTREYRGVAAVRGCVVRDGRDDHGGWGAVASERGGAYTARHAVTRLWGE